MNTRIRKVLILIETGRAINKAPLVIGIVLSLGGCVGMNGKFDCNVNSGGRCAPMHQIHNLADQGIFNDALDQKQFKNIENSNLVRFQTPQGYPLDHLVGKPIRSAETIQQIWIGPYEDASGNYHEPAYIYAVVKKGSWLSEEKEVIQD